MTVSLHSRLLDSLSADAPPVALAANVASWKAFEKSPFEAVFSTEEGLLLCTQCKGGVLTSARMGELLKLARPERVRALSAEHPIGIFPSDFGSEFGMDSIGIAHPAVARFSVTAATDWLREEAYIVFPCHSCEFARDSDLEEAQYRFDKVVNFADPTRSVDPVINMRFHLKKSGKRSSRGNRLLGFLPKGLRKVLRDLDAQGGFAEVENYLREMVRVDNDGTFAVSIGDATVDGWTKDQVSQWLDGFLRRGLDQTPL